MCPRGLRPPSIPNRSKCGHIFVTITKMPETTTTTVVQDSEGYYRVRVPKSLGDAMSLADTKVEWSVDSGKSLKITKVDDDD